MVQRSQKQVLSSARYNISLAGEAGRQLQRSGERITKVATDMEEAQANDYVSTAGSDLTLADNQAWLELQNQRASNPDNASNDYLSGLDERYKNAIDNAPNEQAKAFLEKRQEEARTRYGIRTQDWEYNQNVKNQVSRLNQNRDNLVNQALSIDNEKDLQPLLEQNIYNSVLASKHLDGEQIKEFKREGIQQIYNAYLGSQAINNPTKTLDELSAGRYDSVLDPNQKLALMASSLRQNDKIEKEQDKAVKEQQDINYYVNTALLAENKLNENDIHNAVINRDITASAGRALLNKINQPDAQNDDPFILNELYIKQANNILTANDVLNSKGKLTSSTIKSFLSSVNDPEKKLSSKTYQEGLSFIKLHTMPVGIFASVDFEAQERLANLNRIYQERVMKGENPTLVSQELVDSYKNREKQTNQAKIEIPTGINKNSKKDLIAERARIVKEYKAGKYTEIEANQLLENIERLLENAE